jgi:transcriptional regulator with XRE-family HTH domain
MGMALGSQVRHYRIGLGWTLDRLSDLSGVETGTISAIEKRNSKRSEHGPALARAFGLSLEQLLDESTDHLATLRAGVAPILATGTGPERMGAPMEWPFRSITIEQWQHLGDQERAQVEAYARGFVDSNRIQRKSRTGTSG